MRLPTERYDKKMKTKLKNYCIFEDELAPVDPVTRYPRNTMGYMRCDYDGRKWHSNGFPINRELENPERIRELDSLTGELMDLFPDLESLAEFCNEHAEDLRTNGDYFLYYSGVSCNFKIQVSTRRNDYNLRVFAFAKGTVIGDG